MATPSIFMKLTIKGKPVIGDVTVLGFETLIAIENCSWSNKAQHRSVGKEERRTTWSPGHFKFTKVFDRSSTALYGAMKGRERVDNCILTMLDTSLPYDQLQKMLEIEVVDGYLESISTRASDAGSLMRVGEDIVLSFRTGKLSYYPAHPTQPGRDAATVYEMPEQRSGGT